MWKLILLLKYNQTLFPEVGHRITVFDPTMKAILIFSGYAAQPQGVVIN